MREKRRWEDYILLVLRIPAADCELDIRVPEGWKLGKWKTELCRSRPELLAGRPEEVHLMRAGERDFLNEDQTAAELGWLDGEEIFLV